ncbi:MAG: hypothetical protein ACE5JQ_00345 [Candidatus Methylomirabilales bacterium]
MSDRLARLIQAALGKASDPSANDLASPALSASTTLGEVDQLVQANDLDLMRVLAEATLGALRISKDHPTRDRRDNLRFLVADRRAPEQLRFTPTSSQVTWALSPLTVHRAVTHANRAMELLHDVAISNGVPLFHLLGMRNLSSFVGEVFKRELHRLKHARFALNPNQDGYPDLLALTPEGAAYIREREERRQMSEKQFWSPYPHGGVEIKATCGNTPPARQTPKPQIGESRIPLLVTAEWKAHHQNTNNLIGLYWDFVDGVTTILAAFYRNDLTPDDWGTVIVPGEGSRTTSVSIMVKGSRTEERGVRKMGRGWLVLPTDTEMLTRLSTVFAISLPDIRSVTSHGGT